MVKVQWIEVYEGFLESVILSDVYILHVSGKWMKLQDLGSENFMNAWNMLGVPQNWICFAQWAWRKYMSFFQWEEDYPCFSALHLLHSLYHRQLSKPTSRLRTTVFAATTVCIEVTDVASSKTKDRACYSQTHK